jgi:hypothetical protein
VRLEGEGAGNSRWKGRTDEEVGNENRKKRN